MPSADEVQDLKAAIAELRATYRRSEEDLFTAWVLHMLPADDEQAAVDAVVNRSNERNVDGVFIDDDDDLVTVTQTKYRIRSVANRPTPEHRNDVVGFAELAAAFLGSEEDFDEAFPNDNRRTAREVRDAALRARRAVQDKGYRLHLVFATLGSVSWGIEQDAMDVMKRYEDATLDVLAWRDVFAMLEDYVHWGIGPLVREVTLPVEQGMLLSGPDDDPRIESWVFSISAENLASVYKAPKNRLFARNIRAPLGETSVNKAIRKTLRTEPDHFWFFNNGITLVCDQVEEKRRRGATEALVVRNPQIINGQQTTVSIAAETRGRQKATLVARVIRVPRERADDRARFNDLVSKIVAATNWQNQISTADLRSTDPIQIEIARKLYRRDYLYVRKRGLVASARSVPANRTFKKEDLAKAVADCILGPAHSLVHGESALFSPEESHYERIFRNRDVDFLLACFWMRKNLEKVVRPHPLVWKQARLFVQYLLWEQLDELRGHRQAFRSESELWSPARSEFTRLFVKASEHLFRTAATSYNQNAGRGANRIEPTTYFKSSTGSGSTKESDTYGPFQDLWSSRTNADRRRRFRADRDALLKLLEER